MEKKVPLTTQIDRHLTFCTILLLMNPVARLIEIQKGAVKTVPSKQQSP
jgi:hypothetical protein